jgi:hypothetical protein
LRLVSEAHRFRLAHLFDPYLAIHTSRIEPLPHQITAVCGEMLPRQPLRFLLADDPGAGKTVIAGLVIKELLIRGDLERCLIVAPGSLVEQWQDELSFKFGLSFDILTRDQVEAARTGNPFGERALLIARLDMLSRSDDLKTLLGAAREWDLAVCDEAHRMPPAFRRRDQVHEALSARPAPRLALSAFPPAVGDTAQRQGRRFPAFHCAARRGPFRGPLSRRRADLMGRLTKEGLFKFDGHRLFPERRAYSAEYELSDDEAALFGSDDLCPRRDEPGRAFRRGQRATAGQCRLRPANPCNAASPHHRPREPAAPPRAAGKALSRGAARRARRSFWRKLIIFTEPRDTLAYLADKIRTPMPTFRANRPGRR